MINRMSSWQLLGISIMESNGLHQFLSSKSPLPSTISIHRNPSAVITFQTQTFLPQRGRRSLRALSSTGSDDTPPPPPTITPPDTVEVRFKRGSKRRRRERREDDLGDGQQPMKAQAAADPPKKWEDMNLTEKAMELYMGEKGLLFWLNKFAYASIFIVIGGWILFRFVGPALDLYQLDTPPLAPTSMFKGS